jgi:hypothetical protein
MVAGHALKALSRSGYFIGAWIEGDKGVEAGRGGDGGLDDAGGVIERGNFGAGDDGAGRIGDQAGDAPASRLGPGGRSRTSKSIEIQRKARREREVLFVFILAISNQNVDIQTFE